MIEIRNRYTGAVLYRLDAETLVRANLRGANLREADLEKFAELIVRECADVCLTATEKESSVHLVSVAYADAVKKHFGVE